jgi:hypothetical protein
VELAQQGALACLPWTVHDDDSESFGEQLQVLAR